MQNKVILGFAGPLASGKGTVCKYLEEKYGADYFRFSSILRDILDRVYLPHTRENMQLVSTVMRQNFGEELLAKAMAEDVVNSSKVLVGIDGVRRLADIKHLLEIPGFYLVSIDADIKTRYERLVKRNENPGDTTKTFEQFVEDNKKEAEQQIAELQKQAKFTINNNGDLQGLYRQGGDILGKGKG